MTLHLIDFTRRDIPEATYQRTSIAEWEPNHLNKSRVNIYFDPSVTILGVDIGHLIMRQVVSYPGPGPRVRWGLNPLCLHYKKQYSLMNTLRPREFSMYKIEIIK